jgi:hypothetical protein
MVGGDRGRAWRCKRFSLITCNVNGFVFALHGIADGLGCVGMCWQLFRIFNGVILIDQAHVSRVVDHCLRPDTVTLMCKSAVSFYLHPTQYENIEETDYHQEQSEHS